MILIGSLLLITAVSLVWFRTPLTGMPIRSDGPENLTLGYFTNQSGEMTVLVIGGLLGILGIGMILVGLSKKPVTPGAPSKPESN